MKLSFWTKLIICFLMLFVADKLIGVIMNYAVMHVKNGSIYEMKYKLFEARPSIIILGSSRANHHYNTHLIEEKFQKKTINYGQDGTGIPYYFLVLKTLMKYHKPDMVIVDVKPDEFAPLPNFNPLSTLYPFIDKVAIETRDLEQISPYENLQLKSNAYRFNNQVIETFSSMRGSKEDTQSITGYLPLPAEKRSLKKIDYSNTQFESSMFSYFLQLIELCKKNNIKLVLCASPYYYNVMYDKSIKEAEQVCKKENIQFLNYFNNRLHYFPGELFRDEGHLNGEGADIFTKDFLSRIQ
ncbi:MAG: hypothetical protein ABJA79_07440 [Parafilimonas sp.]